MLLSVPGIERMVCGMWIEVDNTIGVVRGQAS